MSGVVIPFLIVLIISLLHFDLLHIFGKGACLGCSPYKQHIISFTIGITLGSLFLHSLPEVFGGEEVHFHDWNVIPLLVLMGFLIFLFLEHISFKHVKRENMEPLQRRIHLAFIAGMHVIYGAIIFSVFDEGLSSLVFFFIAIVAFNLAEDFSIHFLHGHVSERATKILPFTPIIGFLLAWILQPTSEPIYLLQALATGVLLYMVTTELIPQEREREILFFLAGIGISVLFAAFL